VAWAQEEPEDIIVAWEQEETEDIIVASKEIYLGERAERTKIIKVSREQNVRRTAKYQV
jgi:hypothetical protein